jgi:DNA-binding response OmpR family regulator
MYESYIDRKIGGSILLIEDDQSHAAFIRRVFEDDSSGWKIDHVTSIKDAREWLNLRKDGPTATVIADYRLPDGTGLDLAGGTKSPEEIGFPLIILTGVGSEKLAVLTLKSGAMDYVVKGSEELQHLPVIVKYVLREWDLIQERKSTEESLKKFIGDLERANSDLEEFVEKLSHDLMISLSNVQSCSNAIKERCGEKIDDASSEDLVRIKEEAEKISMLMDSLFESLVPIHLDSSFIKLCNAKLLYLKHGRKSDLIEGPRDKEIQG